MSTIKDRIYGQVRSGLYYLVPSLLSVFLPLISIPIFANILTVEQYGALALSQSVALFINGIANFGLISGFERNFFKSDKVENKAAILYTTILFVIISSALFGLLLYISSDLIANVLFDSIIGSQNLMILAYTSASFTAIKSYFLTYYKNESDAKNFVRYSAYDIIIGFVLSLFFTIVIGMKTEGILLGQMISGFLILSLLLIRFYKRVPVSFNIAEFKEVLRISLPLTPKTFFSTLSTQFDKYLIGMIGSIGGVGIYNLGQRIANSVNIVIIAIQNVFSPQVYSMMFETKDPEESGKEIGAYLTPFFYFSCGIALLMVCISEEVVLVLLPDQYSMSIDVAIIFAMMNVTFFFGKQPQLIYARKAFLISIIAALGIIVNFGINYYSVSNWGIRGAAWGTFSATFIMGLIMYFFSQYYYKIFYNKKLIFSCLTVLFLTGISDILLRHLQIEYIFRLGLKFSMLLMYFFVGITFGIITKEKLLIVMESLKSPSIKIE